MRRNRPVYKVALVYAHKLLVSYLIVAFVFYTSPANYAYANPQGGVVSGGLAEINELGKSLTVNQSTDRAVIDWRSFNIEVDETTRFNQPSASAMTLNRVNDRDPSRILGSLSANGNVVLVNPNGVFFGHNSKIDVNGLVATTANISNNNFMNNNLQFESSGSNPGASVINEGQITAGEAGLVGLVAPNVKNSGVITARLGKVHMASGDRFNLDMYGDGLVGIGISDEVSSQVVQNTGTVNAVGGTIRMTAAAGRAVVNSLIEVKGELNAPAVAEKNGKIYIFAEGLNAVAGNVSADKGVKSGESTVLVSGKLNASGRGNGEKGGAIDVLGDRVAILSGAEIDASGDIGGGTVHIGGDYRGLGDTPSAKTTVIQKDAVIKADAITNGNGGTVIAWSDGYTSFGGKISVKGGAQGGDGGFVETSGHDILSVTGTIDATSTFGKGGTWLLDPRDVIISTGTQTGSLTSDSGTPTDTFTPHADDTVINVTTITDQLNAGTSVIITTGADGSQAGNITVSNAILKNAGGAATLTLNAAGSIIVNAGISSTSNILNIVLNSDFTDAHSGNIQVVSATIDTNGGYLQMLGGSNGLTASSYAYGTATTSIATRSGIYLSGATITTGAGAITMMGHGLNNGTTNYGVYQSAGTTSSASGIMNITGTGGNGTSNNYGVFLTGAATMTTGSNTFNLTGTGGNGTTNQNRGVYLNGASIVSSTDGGVLTVTGYGSGRTSAGDVNVSSSSTANYGVMVDAASKIKTTGTGGNLIVNGYGANTNTSDNVGVNVNAANSSIFSSGTGTVTVNGMGGLGTTNEYGVYVNVGSITTASATLIVTGTGGVGTSVNQGVKVNGAGTISSTGGGDISVYGYGSGSTTTANTTIGNGTTNNFGVSVNSGSIKTTGVGGNLVVVGYGGNGTTNDAGVFVTTSASSIFSSGTGTVSVTGVGGAGTNTNYGVFVSNGSITTATSALTVTGTGGTGGTTSSYIDNYGVFVTGATGVISSTGDGASAFTINGYGANGYTTNYGVSVQSSGSITTKTAALTINGYGGDGTFSANNGVYLTSTVSSSGSGTIAINTAARSGAVNSATSNAADLYLSTLTANSAAVALTATGGGITFNQNVSANSILANTTGGSAGDITIASGVTLTETATSGNKLVLASGRNFVNNSGSGALVTSGTAHWLIYSTSPSANTLGGLAPDSKIYNKTYANYAPDSVTQSGNVAIYSIAPVITVTANAASRTYGDANPALSSTIVGSYIDGDTDGTAYSGAASTTSAATSTSNVGSYAINAAAGTLASSLGYTFNYVNGSLSVSQAALTVTASTQNLTYGTSLGSTAFSSSGLKNSDSISGVTLSSNASTSTSGKANVGSWTITSSAATGGAFTSSNYSITYATGALTVSQAALTITGLSSNGKVYDGTTTATLTNTSAALSGKVSGDAVSLSAASYSAAFADKNVGTGKTITASGYTISGADAANYTLSQPTSLSANVTAAILTISGFTVQSKTYDKGLSAVITSDGSLYGVITGDTVNINNRGATASFDSKNVGTTHVVTASGYALSGAEAGNYSLYGQPTATNVSINSSAGKINANFRSLDVTSEAISYAATLSNVAARTAEVSTVKVNIPNNSFSAASVFNSFSAVSVPSNVSKVNTSNNLSVDSVSSNVSAANISSDYSPVTFLTNTPLINTAKSTQENKPDSSANTKSVLPKNNKKYLIYDNGELD